jgi:transposase
MEACGAAHHWARILSGLGHTVKLIAPEAVKPFVKTSKKNDAADAAAICEAASRPDVKFVPVKTVEQQQGRVAGLRCRSPAPSEPDGTISRHPAQASAARYPIRAWCA